MKSKMPCGHDYPLITQHATWFTMHAYVPHLDSWSHQNQGFEYNGAVDIQCLQCHRTWHFTGKNSPKWVVKLLGEAVGASDEESRQQAQQRTLEGVPNL